MPSGTSRKTVSNRQTRSSSSPAAAGGACDGPAPGSSQRRLCVGLSAPAGPPATASLGRLAPRGGLSCSRGTGAWNTSTSRPRGATSAQAPNKQQTTISMSIHQNICTRISTTYYKSQNINTSHTSVIKCLPRRQYHIGVPPEVHPRIRKLEYDLRRLPPYLRSLLREIVPPFATTVANQNLGPPPQTRVSYSWYLQHYPRPQRRHPL